MKKSILVLFVSLSILGFAAQVSAGGRNTSSRWEMYERYETPPRPPMSNYYYDQRSYVEENNLYYASPGYLSGYYYYPGNRYSYSPYGTVYDNGGYYQGYSYQYYPTPYGYYGGGHIEYRCAPVMVYG